VGKKKKKRDIHPNIGEDGVHGLRESLERMLKKKNEYCNGPDTETDIKSTLGRLLKSMDKIRLYLPSGGGEYRQTAERRRGAKRRDAEGFGYGRKVSLIGYGSGGQLAKTEENLE